LGQGHDELGQGIKGNKKNKNSKEKIRKIKREVSHRPAKCSRMGELTWR
jgi:hypothetical protein